jgi:hypothetical protein
MSDQLTKSGGRRFRFRIKIVMLVVAALIICRVVWGALPDSRFTMDKLGGLTPEQVIDRVGPPDYDGRNDTSDPWTPEKEKEGKCGPLILTYKDRHSWRGIEYGIEFEDNHVVLVQSGAH